MTIKVEFEIELPNVRHSEEDLEEFLRFEYNDSSHMKSTNPFIKKGCEPVFGTFEWFYEDVNDELIEN
jgi:hypothetical protein